MCQAKCTCNYLTEEKVREIAEEIATSTVRKLRLASQTPEWHPAPKGGKKYYYDLKSEWYADLEVVLEGDVEVYNFLHAGIRKQIEEATGVTFNGPDVPFEDFENGLVS